MYAFEATNISIPNPDDVMIFTNIPDLTLLRRGKDKDVYDLGDMLLMVSTDRLSTLGKSLVQGFRGKGEIVNQLSAYWFRKLGRRFPNHLVSDNFRCFPESIRKNAEFLEGRSMLVWKTKPLPVRFVVRGYLAGSGWREYQEKREICGIKLPGGLQESQRLPHPVFAPTAKLENGGVYENVEFHSLQRLLGKPLAEQLRETSLGLYFSAWKRARERGVLIADTKFEFGFHDGKLMLIDECLTPDTSRLWSIDKYFYGGPMPSMDKQLLIDYLENLESPEDIEYIPEALLRIIGEKYSEAFTRIMRPEFYDRIRKSNCEINFEIG
jgi:phosphoribosylaminoimidazole-succinocarboxamide synthase